MTTHPTRLATRRALLGYTAAAAAALAGCAGLAGPQVVTLSEAQLSAALQQKFPFDTRLLDWLDLQVRKPRLRLLPETHRLATDLELSVGERLLRGGYHGELSLDYGLRFEPSDASVRLTQVRVQRLRFDDLPAALQSVVERIGPLVAGQLLDDLTLYRFTPDDLRRLGARGVEPAAVTVTPRGVQITLSPTAR